MGWTYCWGLLLLAGVVGTAAEPDSVDAQDIKRISCSQSLLRCEVEDSTSLVSPEDFAPVEVSGLDVTPMLCFDASGKCRPCLQINIQLRILPQEEDNEESSGKYEDENQGEYENGDQASIRLCYTSGPNLPICRTTSFILTAAAQQNPNASVTVVEYEGIFLGSSVDVVVKPLKQLVTLPKQPKVCCSEECKSPIVSPEIDRQRGVVILKEVSEAASDHNKSLQTCVKRGRQGTCRESNGTVSLLNVTPCMCFQVWREGSSIRSEICPFVNKTEFRDNVMRNINFSVRHTTSNTGNPVLSWNLTAPCRLRAELWPCRLEAWADKRCKEVAGFRMLVDRTFHWQDNKNALLLSGAFEGVSSSNHLLHCVMLNVEGEIIGPTCQYDTRRGRLSTPVLVTLLLLCLAAAVVCVLWEKLKGWPFRMDERHHSEGGRGEVLLLHACGSDPAQTGLVCKLGTELSKLGFSVSLDLWSQAEVCAVGPGPWLHYRLSHLQRRMGKALLLLSDSAVDRAKVYWDSWNAEMMKEGQQGVNQSLLSYSDVFASALSCVFSDHLQGGATERFSLVRLDSQGPLNRERALPELFRGLPLYQLPSEARRLLAELCGQRPEGSVERLKRLLWLRNASRRLTKGLQSTESEQRLRTESELTQVDTLSQEMLEVEETIPLRS